MLLVQVPATRTNEQNGGLLVEFVLLTIGIAKRDGAANGIAYIDLALNGGIPGGGVGIFKVAHKHLRGRIERVDHHLAIHRSSDLDATILQIRRLWRDGPRARANIGGFGKEIRHFASVNFGLPQHTLLQQFFTSALKCTSKLRHETHGLRRQNLRELGSHRASNFNPLRIVYCSLTGHKGTFLSKIAETLFPSCAIVAYGIARSKQTTPTKLNGIVPSRSNPRSRLWK